MIDSSILGVTFRASVGALSADKRCRFRDVKSLIQQRRDSELLSWDSDICLLAPKSMFVHDAMNRSQKTHSSGCAVATNGKARFRELKISLRSLGLATHFYWR